MQLFIFLMHIKMLIEGAWNVHSSCILVAFFLMHLQCTLEVQNSSQITDGHLAMEDIMAIRASS